MPGTLRTARPRAQLRQGRNDWYRISNNAGTGPAVVHIYGEIGYWGVTAADFVRDLAGVRASEIELHLNSPGGEIFDGIAIMNALRSHPATVTTYVDSLAASIASVIAMGGDRVVMAPNSQMMIHEASSIEIGNAADMRKMADLLDLQSDNIASVYAAKAGGDVAEWRARMTAESWYTAEEAVVAGLADEVSSVHSITEANSPQDLSWDLSIFNYAGRDAAPNPLDALGTSPTAEPEPADAVQDEAPAAEPPAAEQPAEAEPLEPLIALTPEPDPWADMVAHFAAAPADPWAALTAHFTTPTSPERGDQSKEDA
ncbi:head maturation protease, ClpP-related [Kitasatospora cineracea]|uniref:head maturation protease, ClpP-related n=1 Tax=Kitasatospora cineracea TaxID=88074 RepID=UPI0036B2A748